MDRNKKRRFWAVIVTGLVLAAWAMGFMRLETSLVPSIERAIPGAHHVVRVEDGLYKAWADEAGKNLSGYIAIGRSDGYGGPLTLVVAVDTSGKIIHTVISDHKETPAWIARVVKRDLLATLDGKHYTDPFEIGNDIDAVTGATATSKAITEAALCGARIAARHLGLPLEKKGSPGIIFGIPEILLLGLFAVVYMGHSRKIGLRRKIRWGTMLAGMIVLGFVYNRPFTLMHVSKLVMGYLPQWQTGLYWYFLTVGILLIFILEKRNTYCGWFCPFGAAQECMGLINKTKLHRPEGHGVLKIMQRVLATGAVLLGLYFRNPGLSNYELYGSLFSLVGTSVQFAALGLVLVAAMLIKRPWCEYLCPIPPLFEVMHIYRRWVKEIWQRRNTRA